MCRSGRCSPVQGLAAMSELTLCNHCTLADIRRRHAGKKIELRIETWDGESIYWTTVYVDDERLASFLELTAVCVC